MDKQPAPPTDKCRALLQRILQWDMLENVADGPYWATEIKEALASACLDAGAPQPKRRYFTNVNGFGDATAYVFHDEQGRSFGVNRDGHEWLYTAGKIERWLEFVAEGKWCELTADEARKLAAPALSAVGESPKEIAYDNISKRADEAQEYCQKYLMPEAWGSNIWHAILDDAIRLRKK